MTPVRTIWNLGEIWQGQFDEKTGQTFYVASSSGVVAEIDVHNPTNAADYSKSTTYNPHPFGKSIE